MSLNRQYLKDRAIADFSAAELREMADEKEKILKTLPEQFSERAVDDRSLRHVLSEYVKRIAHYGELDGDDEHYIYEAVMEAYYGKDIWEFINNRTQ